MIRVGIAGASGYTGSELIRLLLNHPEATLTVLTSEKHADAAIASVFPSLRGLIDLSCESLKNCDLKNRCDLVFSALPHREGMDIVGDLVKTGKRVIDLSADFRLKDFHAYESWYGVAHTQKDLLDQAVYGLPEIHRDQVRSAALVANPGCYPTGAILGLAPLLKAGWISTSGIVVDSKSGTSGAGRNAGLPLLFPECNEGVKAYNIGTHRHTPEMEQEMAGIAGKEVRITFAPHLIPVNRGILSTIYCDLKEDKNLDAVLKLYADFYASEPFVRLLEKGSLANTRYILGSNYCDIGIALDARSNALVVTTAIDNLMKGASGAAIQNMNVMFGFPEGMGLKSAGLFP
jgi:N-acetyl-gamma-glutamyl-phosphate reductase